MTRNKYRVDTGTMDMTTPCGMNSIRYLGSDRKAARRVMATTPVGLTAWNVRDPAYGLLLSEWTGNDYVVIARRGNITVSPT